MNLVLETCYKKKRVTKEWYVFLKKKLMRNVKFLALQFLSIDIYAPVQKRNNARDEEGASVGTSIHINKIQVQQGRSIGLFLSHACTM